MKGNYLFAAAILIVVFVYLMYKYAINFSLYMPAEEARAKILAKDFDAVVDVRTNKEFTLGHAADAIHLPTSEEISSILPDKAAQLLLYCNTGHKASAIADTLYGMGYKNVHYISGSYMSLR